MKSNTIYLYPSNWLYNAGVIGFLRVLAAAGQEVENWLQPDGSLEGDLSKVLAPKAIGKFSIPVASWYWLRESWDVLTAHEALTEADLIKEADLINEVWGKLFNVHYRGFFNANTRYLFTASGTSEPLISKLNTYILGLSDAGSSTEPCSFCFRKAKCSYKNMFTSEHSNLLGGSAGQKGVPNSFWNCNPERSLKICDFCSYILLHQHLGVTRQLDGSEFFINSPSFKEMYTLNHLLSTAFGKKIAEEARSKRELLAMSVLEYATKVQATLGTWTSMAIEVISKRRDEVEYFVLPSDLVRTISDREVASVLSEIGEFKILDVVLNEDYKKLVEVGYRLLRIAVGERRNKSDNKFINSWLAIGKNKRTQKQLHQTASAIFRLYSIIEQKQRRISYGSTIAAV